MVCNLIYNSCHGHTLFHIQTNIQITIFSYKRSHIVHFSAIGEFGSTVACCINYGLIIHCYNYYYYSIITESENRVTKVFVQQDMEEEGMDHYNMQYRNNKPIIDALLNNPDGLFYVFDDATKNGEENSSYIESNNGTVYLLTYIIFALHKQIIKFKKSV